MPLSLAVDVTRLPDADQTSLCALKLMVEVEVGPLAAFEVAEAGTEQWKIDYLKSGPGLIGPDVVDTASLGRARAWRVEVQRQRRMASLRGERLPELPSAEARVAEHQQTAWKVPQARTPLSESGLKACAAFEALALEEASNQAPAPQWLDVSDFVSPAGFVPVQDRWALALDATLTQLQPA